jgi:hypothetical protein
VSGSLPDSILIIGASRYASKGKAHMQVESCALEWGEMGMRINAVMQTGYISN